jgi:hypothetical protein
MFQILQTYQRVQLRIGQREVPAQEVGEDEKDLYLIDIFYLIFCFRLKHFNYNLKKKKLN